MLSFMKEATKGAAEFSIWVNWYQKNYTKYHEFGCEMRSPTGSQSLANSEAYQNEAVACKSYRDWIEI